ncbi:isoprenylcysteine carboxylmethyltransferase family protein [Streptomyces sp. CC224B]|uniref:methyltransferase family protein n=1 Tax=Streptomyces sp. CC224B TaxID=3044571 RepID=UPI0024A95CE1|nr:isoprenylcysteine carboxylmethyltransferase family protein [Streptomyces sp. CC224B]
MGPWTGWVALSVHVTAGVVGFGLRSWLHHRATGDNGYRFTPAAPGTPPWWSPTLSGAGLALGALGPLLVALGAAGPEGRPATAPVFCAGLAVAVAGYAGVFAAQQAMGRSWRIGVAVEERTALVTGGVFGLVRNPIYTSLLVGMAGVVVMVPGWLPLLAWALAFTGVELQVRTVEEPYLVRAHGAAYLGYTARVGRFLPGLGRAGVTPAGQR